MATDVLATETLAAMCSIPLMALGLGFSASPPSRKLAFGESRPAAFDQMGIFAVQHLRICRDWLNSMQPGNDA
jgi:hypothetical protein